MFKLLTSSLLAFANAAPEDEKFSTIPNATMPNQTVNMPTDSYSGYLNVTGLTGNKSLHYVLITSASETPTTDPLLMWFNGGPGCSSMLGLWQENGPWVIDDDTSTMYVNPYSWNNQSNVLYIESPSGVGYSIMSENEEDVAHSDMTVSQDAFNALKVFYEKFPEYVENDLFISGESYAGLYVPYLAW